MALNHRATWWSPVVHFGVHVLAGSLIFVLISLPASGIGLLVQYLAQNGTAPYVIQMLTVLEYAIITLDALVLLTYFVNTSIYSLKEMMK